MKVHHLILFTCILIPINLVHSFLFNPRTLNNFVKNSFQKVQKIRLNPVKNLIQRINPIPLVKRLVQRQIIEKRLYNKINDHMRNKITDTTVNQKIHEELEKMFQLSWYVIEETRNMKENILYKKTIHNKNYVVWKNKGIYHALDDACCHRGASLSRGILNNEYLSCPYHGLEFNGEGRLLNIPGETKLNYSLSCFQQNCYPITEKNGWVYLNTIGNDIYKSHQINLFEAPESQNNEFGCIYYNAEINSYARIVSENLLDIMHISYVHSFGNTENPLPINEPNPLLLNPTMRHYQVVYLYVPGKDSIVTKLFSENRIIIENEFILPHTVISRVKFNKYTKTIMTFALPIDGNKTRLFVKLYRNFGFNDPVNPFYYIYNRIMDVIILRILKNTLQEDKNIIEHIKYQDMKGKFNMKYDKFPHIYRTLYESNLHKNYTKL